MAVKASAAAWRAWIPPADDLWLIAHDHRDWQCLLHPRALGLGLAGGLLGELVLAGCLGVAEDDEVEVKNTTPPRDAFLHLMLAYIQSEQPLDVRTWLKFFAEGKAKSLVVERMQLAGLVEQVEVSRLGRRTSWALWPSNTDAAPWRPLRLRHLILGDVSTMPRATWSDITLAALVDAVGLLPVVLREQHSTGETWLRHVLDQDAQPDVKRLCSAVQTLVGDVVLSSRR